MLPPSICNTYTETTMNTPCGNPTGRQPSLALFATTIFIIRQATDQSFPFSPVRPRAILGLRHSTNKALLPSERLRSMRVAQVSRAAATRTKRCDLRCRRPRDYDDLAFRAHGGWRGQAPKDLPPYSATRGLVDANWELAQQLLEDYRRGNLRACTPHTPA